MDLEVFDVESSEFFFRFCMLLLDFPVPASMFCVLTYYHNCFYLYKVAVGA
jgi:hypothetical protein